jgi:uncharacterized protein YecT (DUF1311 family)
VSQSRWLSICRFCTSQKLRPPVRGRIAYRDSACQFYDDKIQGTMSIMMHAACHARETARRAMLFEFFSRL